MFDSWNGIFFKLTFLWTHDCILAFQRGRTMQIMQHSLIKRISLNWGQRNWVFVTNSDFLIHISLRSNVVDLTYLKTKNYVRSNNLSLKYHRFKSSSCKDIGIWKFKFVAKNQFLYRIWAAAQIWLVSLKILFNVSRFKSVLNWNRFPWDLWSGSNSLNSDSEKKNIGKNDYLH